MKILFIKRFEPAPIIWHLCLFKLAHFIRYENSLVLFGSAKYSATPPTFIVV